MEASDQKDLPSNPKETLLRGDDFKSMVPILVLVVIHVVAGIVSACLSADQPAFSSAIFIGIVFCQTCLLGMWAGLGTTHWMLSRC
jgi:hypothetical protein